MTIDDRRGPRWRIFMRAGDDYGLSLLPVDSAGVPVVVTSASATVWRNRDLVTTLGTAVDGVTGEITVTFTAADSLALGPGRYRWELKVEVGGSTQQWLTDDLILTSPGSPRQTPALQSATLSVGENVSATLQVLTTGVPGPPGPQGPPGTTDADGVNFVPCGPLTETNVQDALCELATPLATRIPPVKSSIFIANNATATVVSQNVAAKVAGTFLAGPACISCVYNSNRITYVGVTPTRVMAVAAIDVNGPNNQTYLLELRKNGAPVDGARVRIRAGTVIANGSLAAMIPLDTNDFVELWITNTTSGQDPTVVDATIALMN